MSQDNPKYKRLEALLSDAQKVEPEPQRVPEDQIPQALKVQIPQPDAKPVVQESETLKAQVPLPNAQPLAQQPETLKAQMAVPDAKPAAQETETLKAQTPQPDAKPVVQESETLKPELEENLAKAQRKTIVSKPIPKKVETKPVTPLAANEIQGNERNARNAFRVLLAFIVVQVFIMSFLIYQTIQMPTWQLWVMDGLGACLMAFEIVGLIQVRRGRHELGIWLAFIPFLIVLFVIPLLYSGLGALFLVSAVTITILVGNQTLSPRQLTFFILIGVLVGVADLLMDFYLPFQRTTLPGFQNLVYIALVFLLLVLGYAIVRQFRDYSLQTKLITAFVFMALLSMGVVAYSSIQSLRSTLTENIGGNLNNLARTKALEVGQTVKREYDLMNSLAIRNTVSGEAVKANRENILSQAAIDYLDQKWRAADAANNNADPLVASVLESELSKELVRFKEQFPQHVEVFLTDRQGVNVAATNRTSDYFQGDEEWWQTAFKQGVYIGQPEYDESSNTVAINMASAVYAADSKEVVGVLRTTVDFTTLSESLVNGLFGQTGKTDIYLPNNLELELEAEEDGTYHLALEEAALDRSVFEKSNHPYLELPHDNIPTFVSHALVSVPGSAIGAQAISNLDWQIVAMQGKAEALQSVDTQTRSSVFLFVAITLIIAGVAVFLARIITNPIVQLKIVAERVASGDLNAEVKVTSRDEVGTLAATFNAMTSQLRNLVGSLEQRVADRTHDLEIAAEVGRAVSEKSADTYGLLKDAVELISERFHLYYVQIYIPDAAGRTLTLRAGSGKVGAELLRRGHSLRLDANSINSRAAAERAPVIVLDTAKSANFQPNPLLPNTRSEMAIPLIAGRKLVGVLDIQSTFVGALNEANLPAFEALAGQMAIAIQNAELFAEAERARVELESQARRLTRTGWVDYLNAIHKPEQTGYVFDQNQIVPMTVADQSTPAAAGAFSAPIEVTGESIGTFQVELELDKRTAQTRVLVQSVARQVAQQVENLRLLEMAERYRAEAENITRRLTHEGWQEYSSSHEEETLGYAYDLAEVTSLKGNGHPDGALTLAVPLSVRNEAIGQLTVDKAVSNEEAHEIIEAVASQLSSHIENLRLSEQNERRAAELEQAVNRLRELDRLKSSFLANMSHELRTPLNSILGFADVILEELDGPLTANMQNDLGLIQKNGQHLLHLINDVLDMAKIEAGRMNFNIEKFRVHEILDEVTNITSTLASEKNLALFIESDSDREMEILADRTRMRQVMINLVNNSIKFTDKGRISIRASREGDHVLIRVKDTGIGIPADKLEDVFNEFAQVDSSTTRKAGGTGLGLPISRKLIEMHGGRVWAESSGVENEGSTFYVELPIEAQLAEPAEKLEK